MIYLIFIVVAFWALCATLYLIDAKQDCADLEAQLKTARTLRTYYERLHIAGLRREIANADKLYDSKRDCYQRHAALYGDKANA